MSNTLTLKERLDNFWVFPKLSKVKDKRQYSDNYFDFLQFEDKNKTATNLYIHIPFCDSACMFCPYYKLHGKKNYQSKILEYLNTIIQELKMYASSPYFRAKKIASVHFGGGNPLLMSLDHFKMLTRAIKSNFEVEVNDNWALEGSINSIKDEKYVKGLLELGINRMSFGIQTFNESIRKKTNILTEINEIYQGVEILRNAGLHQYCFDMMYNMPDQTMDDLYTDLEKVTELVPWHIDIYNMAVFPNTKMDKLLKTSDFFSAKPSNEKQIWMFKNAHKWLIEHGYKHIAIETYSKKQKQPHIGDYMYLMNNNVLGIGVSSRGYIDGYAYKNVSTLGDYLKQVSSGNFPADLAYKASPEEHTDRTMVFFPITLAIDKKRIENYPRYEDKITVLVEKGLSKWDGNRLVLTEEGKVWSGNISAYFIGEERWNTYIKSFFTSLKEKTNPYNEDYMGVNLPEVAP